MMCEREWQPHLLRGEAFPAHQSQQLGEQVLAATVRRHNELDLQLCSGHRPARTSMAHEGLRLQQESTLHARFQATLVLATRTAGQALAVCCRRICRLLGRVFGVLARAIDQHNTRCHRIQTHRVNVAVVQSSAHCAVLGRANDAHCGAHLCFQCSACQLGGDRGRGRWVVVTAFHGCAFWRHACSHRRDGLRNVSFLGNGPARFDHSVGICGG